MIVAWLAQHMLGEPIEHTRLHEARNDNKEGSMDNYRLAAETSHTLLFGYYASNKEHRQGAKKGYLGRHARTRHEGKNADNGEHGDPCIDAKAENYYREIHTSFTNNRLSGANI